MVNIKGRRIYPFNQDLQIYGGVLPSTLDTLKLCTRTYGMKFKLYRYIEISLRPTHHEADSLYKADEDFVPNFQFSGQAL